MSSRFSPVSQTWRPSRPKKSAGYTILQSAACRSEEPMADATSYPKVAQLKDVAAFRARLAELELDVPVEDRVLSAADGSPMAAPIKVAGFDVGNRWCIHPME